MGRPRARFPRRRGLFVRFSDVEWESFKKALEAWEPVKSRRPNLSEAGREVLLAWASSVLRVEVGRAGLGRQKGGVSDFKRWRLRKAVKRNLQSRRRSAARGAGSKRAGGERASGRAQP